LVDIEVYKKNKGDNILIIWISSDFEEMDDIYSILENDEKSIDPMFYLSNDNIENMLPIIRRFFGNGYIYE
jgi:hypothetical protein